MNLGDEKKLTRNDLARAAAAFLGELGITAANVCINQKAEGVLHPADAVRILKFAVRAVGGVNAHAVIGMANMMCAAVSEGVCLGFGEVCGEAGAHGAIDGAERFLDLLTNTCMVISIDRSGCTCTACRQNKAGLEGSIKEIEKMIVEQYGGKI